jgi:uncharacterized protein (TIGR03086 family)
VELNDALNLASAQFESVLNQVTESELALATPCEKWSVEQLVWHVARGSLMTVRLVDGCSQAEAKDIMRSPVQPEVVDECRRALAAQMVALNGADLEQTAHHPIGDVTVGQLYDFRIMDVTLHTWDLARALGADEQLAPELVAHTYGVLSPMEPFIGQIGIFGAGPSGTLDGDADLQATLLDLSGRRP